MTDALVKALCVHGLSMRPEELPESVRNETDNILSDLAVDFTREDLYRAIRYGMPRVWPFSQDGRPFDAKDLKKNILEAVAYGRKAKVSGSTYSYPRGTVESD